MLSLCNLSDKMKPAANSTPSNTNSNERRVENDPAANREAVKAEFNDRRCRRILLPHGPMYERERPRTSRMTSCYHAPVTLLLLNGIS